VRLAEDCKVNESIDADYLLQMAERIEQNSRDFYALAAADASTSARQVLLQLAEIEAGHFDTFAAMRNRLPKRSEPTPPIDPHGETGAYIRALLAGTFFDPKTSPANYLRGNESRQEILLTAIGLEKETVLFYEAVKPFLAAEADEQVLEEVICEERRHISTLAGLLGPLIRSW